MAALNTGLIYTNDKCIGCNRCISGCPVLGANISKIKDGHNRIYVEDEKCLHCGRCLESCRHGAREYRDDTERFFSDLQSGELISIAVAPSFFIDYKEEADSILGYLQSIGVKNIYHVSLGADIATWGYLKYITEHHFEGGISQSCPSIVNYVEKYIPELIPNLMPIHSPLICTAIYIHKYLQDKNDIAFIGPCIAKKDEIDAKETNGNVNYNVTFARLMEYLKDIDLNGFHAKIETEDNGLGSIYPSIGGLKQNIEHFMGYDRLVRQVDSEEKAYSYLQEYLGRVKTGKQLPLIVDILSCGQGCIEGTGTVNKLSHDDDIMFSLQEKKRLSIANNDFDMDNPYSGIISREERRYRLNKKFALLKLEDFLRTYDSKKAVFLPDVNCDYNFIYNSLYKFTEKDRCIDCHSCGYDSCKEMVYAIATGYNQKENCVHYMRDENLRLYVTDSLTGISNTNDYMRKVTKVINKGLSREYATIFFNIKNFKLINKKFGSRAGDQILIDYARTVTELASENEIIARWGGDQFVGLLFKDRVEKVLDRLLSIPIIVKRNEDEEMEEECRLTIRAAVYELDGTETLAQQVMGQVAMTYAAINKQSKRNILYFDEKLSGKIMHDNAVEEMLEPALKNEEFVVYYQPKVSMASQKLVGAEALVRWNRDGKIIAPMEFIPLCENNGFITQIDFYVLDKVCHDISEWLKNGVEVVKVSFNFSKQHFVDTDVAGKINALAEKWNIPKEYLEVEFTETAYIDEYDNLVTTLEQLKQYGISSSIDDFGTGYSSLSLLQELEFNTLKLDKSFLKERDKDNRHETIIANIIRMARELKMDIIAEGIETQEEFLFLKGLACDVAQGYLFDMPLPKDEFEKRMIMKQYIRK